MKFNHYYQILVIWYLYHFHVTIRIHHQMFGTRSNVGRSSPYITNIAPPDSAYAGSQEVTIFGENFGDNKDSIFVYFNTGSASNIGRRIFDHCGSAKYYF